MGVIRRVEKRPERLVEGSGSRGGMVIGMRNYQGWQDTQFLRGVVVVDCFCSNGGGSPREEYFEVRFRSRDH